MIIRIASPALTSLWLRKLATVGLAGITGYACGSSDAPPPRASVPAEPAVGTWQSMTSLKASPYHEYDTWSGSSFFVWYERSPVGIVYIGEGEWVARGYLYHPMLDSWSFTSITGAPSERWVSGSQVWAGDRFFVWGGDVRTNTGERVCDEGSVYLASEDTWQPMSMTGSPSDCRTPMSVVWTGEQVIAWGGLAEPDNLPWMYFDDGARYTPSSNRWSPMSRGGAPSKRFRPVTLWTGSRMIVWGGCEDWSTSTPCYDDGAMYDPVSDTWSPMSREGAATERRDPASVWTGSEMIVWGGSRCRGGTELCDDGFAYNPDTNSWRALSTVGAPLPCSRRATWTGRYMFLTGATGAGLYNPSANSWLRASNDSFDDPVVAWTGTEVIVWGSDASGPKGESDAWLAGPGLRYTPP